MLYVACYDISCDKSRNRMASALLDYGARIQESVFECLLDDEGYKRLIADIERVPLAGTDKVRIYKLCARCVEQMAIYGPGEIASDPDYYLI